jgi:DNA polymerase-3 subunit gamma/tau
VRKLTTIAKAEGIEVAPEALAAVARLANGGMRDSQSILDQMISFCGKEIAEQDVLDVYGLVSAERITQLARALGTLDFAAIIAAVGAFVSEGRDLYRILVDLEAEVRRALLDAIHNGGNTDKLGASLTTESLMRMLDALHEGGVSVQRGLSEKVNFEVVLLKAAEGSRSRAIDTVLKQLAASEGGPPAATGDEKKN